MISRLQIKPSPRGFTNVTPQSAGWQHVGFFVEDLHRGDEIERYTDARETCLVIITGYVEIRVRQHDFGELGSRATPFDGPPTAIYVPPHSWIRFDATSDVTIATCTAPGMGSDYPARVIEVSPVVDIFFGQSAGFVTSILSDTDRGSHSLVVTEVITPMTDTVPHPLHDRSTDNVTRESWLETTYYHRLSPPQGFAFQRVYTGDRSLDETMAVEDGDIVLAPRGHHPCTAIHGYHLYSLIVTVRPDRV